ncbi:RICIN domain-containing protein [Streptomyces monticola]|uniref:RICIN domain-containing protein n=1 Tax=Streptomyces monticola TaxID=2666263 RepID=A0ABW2JAR9_9ACTN
MALLPDGEYLIKNVAAEDLYIDLYGANPEPNTPIVGWQLTKGDNQKWKITTVNGVNEFTLKSKAGEAYMGLSLLRIFPPLIASEPMPVKWSVEPVGENMFRLAFPYMDGTLTLQRPAQGAQLALEPWRGDELQKWTFESA